MVLMDDKNLVNDWGSLRDNRLFTTVVKKLSMIKMTMGVSRI